MSPCSFNNQVQDQPEFKTLNLSDLDSDGSDPKMGSISEKNLATKIFDNPNKEFPEKPFQNTQDKPSKFRPFMKKQASKSCNDIPTATKDQVEFKEHAEVGVGNLDSETYPNSAGTKKFERHQSKRRLKESRPTE